MKVNGDERIAALTEIASWALRIPLERLRPDMRFEEDLGADGIDRVELMMAVEEAFGMEFEDDEAEGLVSISAIADALSTRGQMTRAA